MCEIQCFLLSAEMRFSFWYGLADSGDLPSTCLSVSPVAIRHTPDPRLFGLCLFLGGDTGGEIDKDIRKNKQLIETKRGGRAT
jgi:hypothetical protein